MDSITGDLMATGDLEAQQYRPDWFVKHKNLLRIHQVIEKNTLGFFILKVVDKYRQPPEAFTPLAFRFGLHNRENLDIIGSEALKLSYAVALGLVGQKWDQFCDKIVPDPRSMLICYDLQEGMTSWREEEIKHVLALDALFLASKYDRIEDKKELWTSEVESILDSNNVFHLRNRSYKNFQHDIFRIENQIPFILIQRVFEYFRQNAASQFDDNHEDNDESYLKMCLWYASKCTSCFMDISGEPFRNKLVNKTPSIENRNPGNEIQKPEMEFTHILGAAYEAICGYKRLSEENLSVKGEQYIRIPSASKLLASGIKIKGEVVPICSMSYKNKCLCLPKMKIHNQTMSFIRNMAWYEGNFVTKGCMFHDYVLLMKDLIKTPADLDILIKSDVIYNAYGSKAFEMLTTLEEGLVEISSSAKHHEMKTRIMKRYKFRRYRLWSEFKTLFCSRPWLVMSTIAIFLVTVATLIQSYTSITGSNGMKPQFPH